MNPRTLRVLEYPKILDRLAGYCAFSAGAALAKSLLPSDDLVTVREWLAQTAEAHELLSQKDDVSFGGVHDLRPLLDRAERRMVLMPPDLLEIKHTLLRARQLRNLLTRLEQSFPHLAAIAANIEPCDHIAAEIGRCINDRGDVVDAASPALGRLRSELRVAQERLLSTLERIVHSSEIKPYLQEALVTQRQGRYVIPVRAEYKGSIDGIVHDQSASGATLFIEPLRVVQQNSSARVGVGGRKGSAPHPERVERGSRRRVGLPAPQHADSGGTRFHLRQGPLRLCPRRDHAGSRGVPAAQAHPTPQRGRRRGVAPSRFDHQPAPRPSPAAGPAERRAD